MIALSNQSLMFVREPIIDPVLDVHVDVHVREPVILDVHVREPMCQLHLVVLPARVRNISRHICRTLAHTHSHTLSLSHTHSGRHKETRISFRG